MYNIDTSNLKKQKKVFYTVLSAGLFGVFLFISIIIYLIFSYSRYDSSTLSTNVKIKHEKNMYSPVYYYTVNGIEYSCITNEKSSFPIFTENLKIHYDSNDPSDCIVELSTPFFITSIIFLAPCLLCIGLSIIKFHKINKRLKIIENLKTSGKLVKNIPYRLEANNYEVNNTIIKHPVIEYTLPTGVNVTLKGDPRFDGKFADADGMVDLLIDEKNPENYFIDFNIDRISGNLPSDYYNYNNNDDLDSKDIN